MASMRAVTVRGASVLAVASLLGILGCGPGGPKTYPVRGKVDLTGGDVSHLAGSHIEAALQQDPTVRASGEIQADGSFALETLHGGVILKGAQEGGYQARVVLTDEDGASKRRASKAVARRYLQFETSGLSFQVPGSGTVNLQLSPR